jgi:hypothetical protein
VDFCLMARVSMIVRPMFARVVVLVGCGVSRVLVGMLVLVNMLMSMGMGVFMGVLRVTVCVLMIVGMIVIVTVHVGVFVVALHKFPPWVVR